MSDDSDLTTLVWLAHRAGIDLQPKLYNSALDCANRSDLGGARNHLLVLTGLFPTDGDAHLLLARVLMARSCWSEAMVELRRADACGADIPSKLLDAAGRKSPEGLESFHSARKIAAENAAARASLTPKPRRNLRLVPTPAEDGDEDNDDAQPGLFEPEAAPPVVAKPDVAHPVAGSSEFVAAEASTGLDQPRRTQSPRTRDSGSASPLLVAFAIAIGLLVLSVALFVLRQ